MISKRVWNSAQYILNTYQAGDMALLSSKPPKTDYTRDLKRPSTHKGGSPPLDYSAVEALVDLRAEVNRGPSGCNPQVVASLTYYLKSILGV